MSKKPRSEMVYETTPLFNRLLESMIQMDEIVRGERPASREFQVDATGVKIIKQATGTSQERFAKVVDVPVGESSSNPGLSFQPSLSRTFRDT
ncbi:hypothetical protein HX882_23945 [Pseudomonas gingeri]|uniref:Uncharacterized protein n=1 Tax=Pseudomonas gingeri TaxID=117681 RepID=A0A7Y7XG05_9PSED|nr:hypothetical protein [Pseudomonas gingeri]NWB98949.1 hypothetical protein [Pseudomonas gingeri]